MFRNVFLMLCLMFIMPTISQADDDYVYLFGYGSLMLTPARTATSPDPEDARFIPVKVQGVARLWNLWYAKSQQRSLDVEPADNPDAYVNGLLFAVKRSQLSAFDQREGPAYQRLQIPLSDVSFYLDQHRIDDEQVEIYFYSPRKDSEFYAERSESEKKIAMSYLNVVRAGCVEIDRMHQLDDRFVDDCVQTLGMSGYGIDNDLDQPRYKRYPDTLWQKALAEGDEEKAKELRLFLDQEWASYLEVISEKWGF